MAKINFYEVGAKHFTWKHKARAFLNGGGTLSQEEAVSAEACELGKWLACDEAHQYDSLPEMVQLKSVHTELHASVKNILRLKTEGNTAGAEEEYKKLEASSKQIVSLLTALNVKVK